MVFKVCNVEQELVDQGSTEGTYDVIVAYLVLHAMTKLDQSMHDLRKLLKPGVFLIMEEGSGAAGLQAGAGFIFGTLPGW